MKQNINRVILGVYTFVLYVVCSPGIFVFDLKERNVVVVLLRCLLFAIVWMIFLECLLRRESFCVDCRINYVERPVVSDVTPTPPAVTIPPSKNVFGNNNNYSNNTSGSQNTLDGVNELLAKNPNLTITLTNGKTTVEQPKQDSGNSGNRKTIVDSINESIAKTNESQARRNEQTKKDFQSAGEKLNKLGNTIKKSLKIK